MKFADITPGRRITLGPISATAQEMTGFAARYDMQWFHTDPALAEAGPWQGLIASGWHTCALAMHLVTRDILGDSESYVSPGLSYLKWPNPLRPDDVLTLDIEVLDSRASSSKPWLGIVRWRWVMNNQDGLPVLDLEATNLFKIGEPADA